MSTTNETPTTLLPLDSVLCTEELNRRPSRPPDYEKQSRTLQSLAQALADSPGTILQALADTMLSVFQCGSAGISLVTEDQKRFHWPAIAGVWKPHIGGGTPRDFGPCGDVLDCNRPLLFNHPERRYAYLQSVSPPIKECLLVPFYVQGKAVGTIWAVTHEDRPGTNKFDSEDLRMLVSLGTFASVAYQAVEQLHALSEQAGDRQEVQQTMREINEALLVSSVRQHELTEYAQKAEAALRDSEVRYRRLFQTAKDGIFILDAHTGKIIDANAFMCGLVGMDVSELLGKEIHEIGMFDDAEANKANFQELQRTRYLRYDHLPLRNRRGEKVEVEFIANVYQEGARLVAQCNVRDIGERSQMEKLIAQQTEALAEQSHRKDEFLAMLSHELRNPLAPIRAAVHLLKLYEGENANPIQKQAREIIERQVTSLTTLVSDLLEVSRVLSGRVRLNLQPVDLKQIVEHAIQTVAPLIQQHRHAISVSLCPEPMWAYADPTRLEEVMVNLLNNAAKYTPDGGRIEVVCEHSMKRKPHGEQSHAVVRVRDNGVGIDKELLPRIFDLFTQADRSLARSAGGLGIGLSLAHRLMALHGGTIEAASRGPGKGSEFVIKLPFIPAPIVAAIPEESRGFKAPTHQGAEPVRVLVVDDNIDLVMMLASALRHKGYNVQSAYTGPDGLKIAQEWRPDVALLDIGLPGLDGYEVARRLRSSSVTSKARLIAITGYGKDADVALAHEAGFDAHLTKPYDFDDLEKLITV